MNRRFVRARKPHIAIGQNTYDTPFRINNWKTCEIVACHQRLSIGERLIHTQGYRIINDSALKTFHAAYFTRLRFHIEVLVDYPHAARLRHCNCHSAFGHRVHR